MTTTTELEQLKALDAAGEWLPIEGAPSDGIVLIKAEAWEWSGEIDTKTEVRVCEIIRLKDYHVCFNPCNVSYYDENPINPTHWQPLPDSEEAANSREAIKWAIAEIERLSSIVEGA